MRWVRRKVAAAMDEIEPIANGRAWKARGSMRLVGSGSVKPRLPVISHVSGRIVKVHRKDVNYKGYIHHASKENPQYEIKSDKSDHIALHKAAALKLLRR